MGESAARSTVAGVLADVLSQEEDDEEAERFVEITRETAAGSDVWPQVLWRRAAARTAARRGDLPKAHALAREAVALANATDCFDLRAGSQLGLAGLLRAAGGDAEAAACADEARSLHERKGNLAALQALSARGPAR